MQNWKIKRMSISRINLWLSAIGKLLKHYEGEVRLESCPLCKVNQAEGCIICPWVVIEGEECEDVASRLYGRSASQCRSNLNFKKWRILRLGQLKFWKKTFMLELARRSE